LERPSSSLAPGVLTGLKIEDDFGGMVVAACGLLAVTDCRFHIEGFGALEWPVDVAYDLSAFVEQLPDLIARIRSRSHAELDLYSQGIERTLEFTHNGELVDILCLSRTDWVPYPSTESMSRKTSKKCSHGWL
jgi:hypothetical protein